MDKVKTWIKIGKLFIDVSNIQSISRQGKGTKIARIIGKEVVVDVEFEKVKHLLPQG